MRFLGTTITSAADNWRLSVGADEAPWPGWRKGGATGGLSLSVGLIPDGSASLVSFCPEFTLTVVI